MITEVILPKLGQTMEEGSIVEWIKKEGDPVQRGDVLFTVESDKAVLEVEATTRGFLRKILVPEGQTVPVLTVVALMTRKADEDLGEYQVASRQVDKERASKPDLRPAIEVEVARPERVVASPRARKAAREKGVNLALVMGTGPNGRIVEQDVLDYLTSMASRPQATPVAVRTAEALGVDLTQVTGTGVSGRITKADVEAAVAAAAPPIAPPAEAPAAESVPLTGLRRIIAERMATSAHTTARVTLVTEADATAFVEARAQLKASVTEEWGFAPGYSDLLGLIVARALREFPYMNARLRADPLRSPTLCKSPLGKGCFAHTAAVPVTGAGGAVIERLPNVNLGMAVDTERGLLVPVIRNADQKGLRAFGAEFRALVERARAGKSLPDDLTGGTFTITSLGTYEIDAFTPVINLPEAAILGVGRIQPKPVVRDGEIVVRQMWTLSLAFDHRLVDGAPAARFLQRIKRLVENPFLMLG